MRYPGDIIYLLMYVGTDVLVISVAGLVLILVTSWYFFRRRKRNH